MDRPAMTHLHHQDPVVPPGSLWLPRAQARRLRAAPRSRWLAVEVGRVWLTRSCSAASPEADIWLAAGQRQWLAPGSEWVVEGWPDARVAVLEAPSG